MAKTTIRDFSKASWEALPDTQAVDAEATSYSSIGSFVSPDGSRRCILFRKCLEELAGETIGKDVEGLAGKRAGSQKGEKASQDSAQMPMTL